MKPLICLLLTCPLLCAAQDSEPATARFATFNVSLNRRSAGRLLEDLKKGNDQAHSVAEIIQTVRPDVLLLNEFDYEPGGKAVTYFKTHYLGIPHGQAQPIEYAFHYTGPVNTGVPSGRDFDKNGRSGDPADSYGYGVFPGQYGMVVLSRFPFDQKNIRTFQKFLWKDMPNAELPIDPKTRKPFYSDDDLQHLRLSSKSHWDIPVRIGETITHFLVSHPTPPAFDGPEDRNGCRNHDEIRFWADYVSPDRGDYAYDDASVKGGMQGSRSFIIAGDLNADPKDGGSRGEAIQQLLKHPRIADTAPSNQGGVLQAKLDGKANLTHKADPKFDTSNFSDRSVGNLRVDYVLPSKDLTTTRSGIFWPVSGRPGADLVGCTDHRLVWIDVRIGPTTAMQKAVDK